MHFVVTVKGSVVCCHGGVIIVCCLGDGLVLFVVTGGGVVTRCVVVYLGHCLPVLLLIHIISSETLVFIVSPSITLKINKE